MKKKHWNKYFMLRFCVKTVALWPVGLMSLVGVVGTLSICSGKKTQRPKVLDPVNWFVQTLGKLADFFFTKKSK